MTLIAGVPIGTEYPCRVIAEIGNAHNGDYDRCLRLIDGAMEAGADIVIGPAEDGGYVLLGLRGVPDCLFADMPWGTAEVMATTRARLRAEGLGFGRYEIFHHLHDDGRPIFSVASLKEPGTFDIESMETTQYPGVAMFAVLPGPVPAADAFDDMIFTARALATHLNGALADERGAPLTALRVGKLREEALEFERSSGQA
jgi:hypothetical protein